MYSGQVLFQHDNHYIIRGCAFGNKSNSVQLAAWDIGKVGNGFAVSFRIEFWNDNEIHVTFKSSDVLAGSQIKNSPYYNDATLTVVRGDGAAAQWGGLAFEYY
jgi:hypothetical protein